MTVTQSDYEVLTHEIDLIHTWAKIPADIDLDSNRDRTDPLCQLAEIAQVLDQARDKILMLEAKIAELLSAKKD